MNLSVLDGSGSGSVNGLSGGVLSGTSATLSVNSMGSASNASSGGGSSSRAKKYRTLNRIKGLLSLTGGAKSEQESLYDLPPQQLKNELLKKINFCQYEIEKYQKERFDIFYTISNFKIVVNSQYSILQMYTKIVRKKEDEKIP